MMKGISDISQFIKGLLRPGLPGLAIIISMLLLFNYCYSQDVTLDYIFQDSAIVNARPSLKFISSKANKMYYYADEDYNGTLDMFAYNYITGETYKFPDTGKTPSEFRVLANGEALSIIDGDLFITQNFVETNIFSEDIRLTSTDEYEYSPLVQDNFVIFRRSGNYFIKRIDTVSKELQLTKDESDSISYQIMDVLSSKNNGTSIRLVFARYDNSPKTEILFPDFTNEFVTVGREKRGISKVKLLECEVNVNKKDSLIYKGHEITFPDTIRYSTQYAAYSPDNKTLILDAETIDRHRRKIFSYDTEKKLMKEIYSESDSAWFERHENATRFINSDEIMFESEVSGFSNLYRIKIDGTGFIKIAGDSYTIPESVIDTKNQKIYFTANIETPVEYNIYETDFSGSYVNKLTTLVGDYEDLAISGEGEYLFYKHSYITKPSEIYFLNLSAKTETQVTNTINPKFSSIDWAMPELITFNNEEDSEPIHGFLYKPKDYSPKKKYPLICFVHGAGYLQNVTRGFSPYEDNFMVNTFLVSQGYLVFEADYRGSAGYGKNFRNKTYRNLGYWEVSDYISGVNHLDQLGIIDRNKVGIYGGSYGGFITLMAVFRHPEYFKAGVALRAVANWKNYFYSNRWFTTARLGNYFDDEAKQYYEISSSITYAENLQVPLLITHGMKDDNVFFQDAVQLTQKLIENKKDFEVMFYPKEYHSFHIQSSWLDQYKRIVSFFGKNLK